MIDTVDHCLIEFPLQRDLVGDVVGDYLSERGLKPPYNNLQEVFAEVTQPGLLSS